MRYYGERCSLIRCIANNIHIWRHVFETLTHNIEPNLHEQIQTKNSK